MSTIDKMIVDLHKRAEGYGSGSVVDDLRKMLSELDAQRLEALKGRNTATAENKRLREALSAVVSHAQTIRINQVQCCREHGWPIEYMRNCEEAWNAINTLAASQPQAPKHKCCPHCDGVARDEEWTCNICEQPQAKTCEVVKGRVCSGEQCFPGCDCTPASDEAPSRASEYEVIEELYQIRALVKAHRNPEKYRQTWIDKGYVLSLIDERIRTALAKKEGR